MLTKYIIEAIQDGYSYDYLSLLHNYGLWARYFGAVGYHCPATAHEDYIIDDESALIVEACMCWLKQTRPQVYKLFSMYYVRGLDEYDILSVLKKHDHSIRTPRARFKDRYDATPYDNAIRYLTGRAVRDVIILGEKLVLAHLVQVYNQEHETPLNVDCVKEC